MPPETPVDSLPAQATRKVCFVANPQVAIIGSLKADVQEHYLRAMRNMTRSALTKALAS